MGCGDGDGDGDGGGGGVCVCGGGGPGGGGGGGVGETCVTTTSQRGFISIKTSAILNFVFNLVGISAFTSYFKLKRISAAQYGRRNYKL